MNYFELYPGDYLRDTGELSLSQHGAYLLLMASYYSTENGLPSDRVGLFRIARAMSKDEQAATIFVAERFFTKAEDGRLRSERIDEDIQKAKARIESARVNGSKGGRPPKAKANQNETQQKPTGFLSGSDPLKPNETQKKAHQTPDPISNSEREMPASTPAGEAGRALRSAGCSTLNLSNPDFLAALEEGVTPDEFTAAAGEAADRQISPSARFSYAVKVARSNHAKAASVVTLPTARAGPGSTSGQSKTRQSVQNMQDTADALIQQSAATLGYQGTEYGPDQVAHAQLGRSSGS